MLHMTVISKKAKYRIWARDLRKTLNIERVSMQIQSKLKTLDVYKTAKTVMSYMAKDLEVNLGSLFSDVTKNWFLPVLSSGREKLILAVPYIHGKTNLNKGKFDIFEPDIAQENYYDQMSKKIKLDVIFVPGLCFDKDGNRLGFGVGYYDRFLKLNPDSYKIGCCPRECLVDKLPTDEWDMKVDLVITD